MYLTVEYQSITRPIWSNKLELLYLNALGTGESFQISQTIPRRKWTEIRWTFKDGKSNVTLEWENFTTYQTFMKPDIRAADLNAEFTIGGSQNVYGFNGIISYFEYNRLSKNFQNPVSVPNDVIEFENKYSKITKQVWAFWLAISKKVRHLVRINL